MKKILVFALLTCVLRAQSIYRVYEFKPKFHEVLKKDNLSLDVKITKFISDNMYTLKYQPAAIKIIARISGKKKVCLEENNKVSFYIKSTNPSIMSTQWEIQEKYLLMNVAKNIEKKLLSSKKYCV